MKKIILFDFDGTIADTLPPALKITNEHLKKDGYPPVTAKELKELRHMNPLQIVTHSKYPIWKVPGLVRQVREDLHKEVNKIQIFPGIKQLILNLKKSGFHLAILTSNLKETIEDFLALHKLEVFDYVQCEPNIMEKGKLLKRFLNEHDLKTSDVIYIGDEIRDIEACKSVGIQIISVTWGFNDANSLQKLNPDFLVKKPQQIFELLKKV